MAEVNTNEHFLTMIGILHKFTDLIKSMFWFSLAIMIIDTLIKVNRRRR